MVELMDDCLLRRRHGEQRGRSTFNLKKSKSFDPVRDYIT